MKAVRRKKYMMMVTVLFISIFVLSTALISVVADESQGEEHHEEQVGCDNPTLTLAVSSKNTKYNVTEIRVPKDTCVQIIYENKDNYAHDISVAEVPNEFSGFHIHLEGIGVANTTFLTPDKDVTYLYYCTVPGHREAGMEGKLIVGEGSAEDTAGVPGFELPMILGTLLAIGTTSVLIRSRKRSV